MQRDSSKNVRPESISTDHMKRLLAFSELEQKHWKLKCDLRGILKHMALASLDIFLYFTFFIVYVHNFAWQWWFFKECTFSYLWNWKKGYKRQTNEGMSSNTLDNTLYNIAFILKYSLNFIKHSIQHSRLENYKQLG